MTQPTSAAPAEPVPRHGPRPGQLRRRDAHAPHAWQLLPPPAATPLPTPTTPSDA